MVLKEYISIASTILKSNITELKKPYKLNFAITYRCQSRCLTCNIWQMRPKGELKIDEIREFAKRNTFFKWIEITGGEPFLNSDIVDIVKAFKTYSKNLFIVTMPTNSLTNHDVIINELRQILELKIPKVAVTVSLDGYKELHDKIRGVPGNYDKAIDLYKRLKLLRKEYKNLYFVFGYTMSNFNKGEFERTFQSVKRDIPEISYNDFHINLAQTSSNYYNNANSGITPFGEEVSREIAEFIKKRRMSLNPIELIESTFLKGLSSFAKSGRMPLRSRSVEASVFLDSFGDVYPSIMWNRKIGNIRESNYALEGILKSKEAEAVRKAIKSGNEPIQWTSCEAYQAITGNMLSMVSIKKEK
ncbi:MAG: radical SAM/SPASM domain-containing protein [Candidatus Micrarchaeia archaeon]